MGYPPEMLTTSQFLCFLKLKELLGMSSRFSVLILAQKIPVTAFLQMHLSIQFQCLFFLHIFRFHDVETEKYEEKKEQKAA